MKQLFLHKGTFKFLSPDKASKGVFNMTKWFKKIANQLHLTIVDDCCEDPIFVPLRLNTDSGQAESYDPVTNTWVTAIIAEDIPGEIKLYAGATAPNGWQFCDGQLLTIQSNPNLFAAIGTTYGGDGITTMQLPDLRGRVPVGEGTGAGLTPRVLGATAGSETLTSSTVQSGSGANVASDSNTNMQPFIVLNYIIKLG